MSDIRHRHFVAAIEIRFERKDHDHPRDVRRDLLHASAPPRPHLRRDVIDDRNAERATALRDAQIEIRIVDEQHGVGTLYFDARDQLIEDAAEHPEMSQHVEEADNAHLFRVMEQRHAFRCEEIASDAEKLERRIELLQFLHDLGRVEVAGSLAGDDGEFHSRPRASRPLDAHASRVRGEEPRARRPLVQRAGRPRSAAVIAAGTDTSATPARCRRRTAS